MRTATAAHELFPEGLRLETLSIGTGSVSIRAASGARRSRCPLCGRGSSRLPQLLLPRGLGPSLARRLRRAREVRARRFFCDEAPCERRIFCERLPNVAARARKTDRLEVKLVKRQGYGRAGLDLLRARVLAA